jgi:hypothetical protein
MESTILPLEMIYEHRNYTGLIGLTAAFAWGVARTTVTLRPGLRLIVLSAPVALLATSTFSRSVDWSSPEHFYASEYRHHPHSFRALLGFYAVLQSNGAFPEVAAALEQEILLRRGDQPWTSLLSASRQCTDASHTVDWEAAKDAVRHQPLGRMSDYVKYLLDMVISGNCPSLNLDELTDVIAIAYRKSYYSGDARRAEHFATLNAWAFRHKQEWDAARNWLWRAARARDTGFEPLIQLAYMELNLGEPARVAEAVEELNLRQRLHTLPISYRIREIEAHLRSLEVEHDSDNR